MENLYIGLMSGTSLDGVDASLVSTDGENKFENISNIHISYPKNFRNTVKKLFDLDKPFLEVEKELTYFHAQAVEKLLKSQQLSPNKIKAIGFHGQTIFHNPNKNITWQIGDANLLAELTKINVVHDFRGRDVILGGQGAPLVPIFHKMLLKNFDQPSAILNIGGVGNVTYVNGENIIAFDTGPGCALIDDMMAKLFNVNFDDEGKIASSGKIDESIVKKVLQDSYFEENFPKSLDRNHFLFINELLSGFSPEDKIANLTYVTSACVAQSMKLLPKEPKNLFLCGGGSKNNQMIKWMEEAFLKENIITKIKNISAISDIPSDYVESSAFGYLAARFLKKLPSSFPNTTGVSRENICGNLVEYYPKI